MFRAISAYITIEESRKSELESYIKCNNLNSLFCILGTGRKSSFGQMMANNQRRRVYTGNYTYCITVDSGDWKDFLNEPKNVAVMPSDPMKQPLYEHTLKLKFINNYLKKLQDLEKIKHFFVPYELYISSYILFHYSGYIQQKDIIDLDVDTIFNLAKLGLGLVHSHFTDDEEKEVITFKAVSN